MFHFLQAHSIDISKLGFKFEFCTHIKRLSLNLDTAVKIELISRGSKSENANKPTIYSLLNTCVTEMGKYSLKQNLLEPPIDLKVILRRQGSIKELLTNKNFMAQIRTVLERLKNMQKLCQLSYSIFTENNDKAIEAILKLLSLLMLILEGIHQLNEILCQYKTKHVMELQNQLNIEPVQRLRLKLLDIIRMNSVSTDFILADKNLFLIQNGVNDFLDILHGCYSSNIDKIRTEVAQYSIEHNELFQVTHSKSKGFYIKVRLRSRASRSNLSNHFQVLHQTQNIIHLTTPKLCELNNEIRTICNEIQVVNHV